MGGDKAYSMFQYKVLVFALCALQYFKLLGLAKYPKAILFESTPRLIPKMFMLIKGGIKQSFSSKKHLGRVVWQLGREHSPSSSTKLQNDAV